MHRIQKLAFTIASLGLLLAVFIPSAADASQITSRKLTLGTSQAGATTSYSLSFTLPSTTVVEGLRIQICTAASGTCTTPSGWSNSGVTLTQPTGLGDSSGWTVDNSTAGYLALNKASDVAAPSNTNTTVTFNNVTNPTATNTTFYALITSYSTYSGGTYSGAVDAGNVAASTATQIQVSGTMPESLVFCTGTSITGQNCGTVSGNAVSLGSFSSSAAVDGTSVMAASTNASSGYAITVTGAVPTCSTCTGSPTIAAMGTQSANGSATTSSAGTAQFGMNLRGNTSLGGADVSGSGTGTYGTNYGVQDSFRFYTGDTVATASAATNANTFTVDYIVNVPGSQPAGTYSSTLTYICTATF